MDRKRLYVLLLVVVCLVASLTIVYALLSTTLTISGSGTVNASSWNIGISNSDGLQYVNTSTGSATYTNPTITGTTISNYTVVLTKPGDSVTLYFRIYNDGDINGEIESVISSTPVCTSVTGNTSDANLVCNNLDVSFTYFDNTTIRPGHILNDDDIICFSSGDDYGLDGVVKVHISLKTSMTSVPSSKVTISNLTHEIKFIQSDKVCDPIGIGGNSPI